MGNRAATATKTNAPAKAAAKLARAKQPQSRTSAYATSALADVDAVLQGGGQPLDQELRTTVQQRLGHDFSTVRVHTDARAAASAHMLNAQAYSVGRHLVFASGEYQPATPAGLRLLTHELAHVVQQGAAPYRPELGLQLSPAASALEHEAHDVAERVSAGVSARVKTVADAGTVQRLQRAEHGTYVSRIGSSPYLDAGEQFYRTWGHPNVKRVSNMMEVLDDLDTAKGTIEKFRIVSHGSSVGLELGLLPEIDKDYFYASTSTEFTTQARFRKEFVKQHVLAESKFLEIYAALWKDTASNALLISLGGSKDAPGEETNLGILLRAIADDRFLDDVQLDTGGKPKIPDVDAIRSFIAQRRSAYSKLVVEAIAKDKQSDARKAIAELTKNLPAVMTAAKLVFGTLTADEAKVFADDFVETPGKQSGLKKSLSKSVQEGAGGPYLKKLNSVRGKISDKTHVEIRGCNVGSDIKTMDALRGYFGNPGALPSMTAPDLFQFFFQLNVKSYHKDEEADLEAAYDDPHLGVKTGFPDITRMKAGEMIRLHVGGKIADLATRYGFNAEKVRKLNPEVDKPDELHSGDMLWLVQREVVPAGIYKTLEDFCTNYVGKKYSWPAVWGANPWLRNPKKISPTDNITVPKDVLTKPFAAVATDKAAFTAAVRSGEAVAGLADQVDVKERNKSGGVTTRTVTFTNPRPLLHIDDAKRSQALGKWLAAQKFDPKGRTAEVLSKRFGKSGAEFAAGRAGTYVQFLTRAYPNAEDPIFPEDPRYDKHIIRRP